MDKRILCEQTLKCYNAQTHSCWLWLFVMCFLRLQEARLTLLVQLLRQREEKQEEVKMDRLDVSFSQHQLEKEARIKKIRNDYIVCEATVR